jgi:5'-nucleotidase
MRVKALVPSREYSWSAKTLTRQGTLHIEQVTVEGDFELFTLSGSPADCANLGVYHLADSKPSLVISGVNMGSNAGLSLLMSSGTVGAAIEAALCGVAAAAFSMQLSAHVYKQWRTERQLDALGGLWMTAATIATEICQEVQNAGLPEGASLLSVNMPDTCNVSTPRRFGQVTPTEYGSFFQQLEPGAFDHRYSGYRILGGDGRGDVELLENGDVAMTAIRLDLNSGEASAADRGRFERPQSERGQGS